MPDANKENTLNQLVGAAFGAAGQRCMALSTAILVGEARSWLPDLVERAKALRVNAGTALSLHRAFAEGPFFSLLIFGGATHTAQNHTSRLSRHIVTTQRGIVESAALQTCGQICGVNPNSRCEHPVP